MADMVFMFVFVEDEVGAGFVDGVVGEVHPHILLVGRVGFLIVAGGQSADPFFVEVDLQGRQAAYEHIQSQVELRSVDQKRVVDILLHHYFFFAGGFRLLGQVDAPALTVSSWLDDVVAVLLGTGKPNWKRGYF